MQRIAGMMCEQLRINCVQIRVQAAEAATGQPGRDVICAPSDTVAKVLRSACELFGVSVADRRLYKDKELRLELPLEGTLASCSISGHVSLYLA